MTDASLSLASELVAAFDEQLERGVEVNCEAFARAHPDVPNLLVKLRALERLRRELADVRFEALAPPPVIPGYRVLRTLGRGGMGSVYLAEQASPRRLCALKLLEIASPTARIRFQREADLAASLAHPGIATVLACGEVNAVPYLVTEYVRGFSLRRLLDVADAVSAPPEQWLDAALAAIVAGIARKGASTPLPAPLAVDLALQLASALGHAHARGVVHRDIKPANLMVSVDGRLKIIDFGIAVPLGDAEDRVTRTGMFVGSPDYASPEQLRGDWPALRHATDVWGAGATLYELLTQVPPYGAVTLEQRLGHLHEPPPRASSRVHDVPPALDRLLERALAIDPVARFADGDELAQALSNVSLAGRLRPRALVRLAPRADLITKYKGARLVVLVLLALAAGIGAAAYQLGRRRGSERAHQDHLARQLERDADVRDWALAQHRAAIEHCLALPEPESKLLPLPQPPVLRPRFVAELIVRDGAVDRVEVSAFTRWIGKAPQVCLVRELSTLKLPGVGIGAVARVTVSLDGPR